MGFFDSSWKNQAKPSNRSSQLFPSYFNINAYRNRKGIIEVIPIFSFYRLVAGGVRRIKFLLANSLGRTFVFLYYFFFDNSPLFSTKQLVGILEALSV